MISIQSDLVIPTKFVPGVSVRLTGLSDYCQLTNTQLPSKLVLITCTLSESYGARLLGVGIMRSDCISIC